jgi:hypothetical protein
MLQHSVIRYKVNVRYCKSPNELWITEDFNGNNSNNWRQIKDLPGTPVSINQYTETDRKLKFALGCTNNKVYFKSSL